MNQIYIHQNRHYKLLPLYNYLSLISTVNTAKLILTDWFLSIVVNPKGLGKMWFSGFFGSINLLWLFFPMIGLISPSILVEDFMGKKIFPKSAKELVYVLCTLLIFSKWRLPFVASTYIKIQLSQWQLLIWRRRIENKRYAVIKVCPCSA